MELFNQQNVVNIPVHDVAKKMGSLTKVFHKKSKNQYDEHLVSLYQPDTIASEQYRLLRTCILKSFNNGSRTFLITSAVNGEGKSLTCANLAISIVKELQNHVLLIDADLRKPKIHEIFGLDREIKGLSEYLISAGDISNYIIKTSIPKLNIMPSGFPPDNPSELINSKFMIDLINEVKYRYNDRFIIIDSAPLVPVTDPLILSSMVDGIIIVIKASSTQREVVNEAIDKIEKKDKIIGLVLNCCEHSVFKYYGNYYKYYREKKE